MDTIDTILFRSHGKATVRVVTVYDESPDLSWLGTYTSLRNAPFNVYLYSTRERIMRLPKSDQWRDERGRIVNGAKLEDGRREYEFIAIDPLQAESLRNAFADAERRERFASGDLYMLGIVATVTLAGRELGQSSIWGIESDSAPSYIRSLAREQASEAIADARGYLTRLAS